MQYLHLNHQKFFSFWRLIRMQVSINLDGEAITFNVQNLPSDVLQIKQEISRRSGIPVEDQNLFDYPEAPDQGPGLRLCADNHIFSHVAMMNAQVSFVLTLGNVSSWVYFYVLCPCADGQRAVLKCKCHRLQTIANLKGQISAFVQGSGLNSFQLSHSIYGKPVLKDDWNMFHSGIQNGSSLHCVWNVNFFFRYFELICHVNVYDFDSCVY